ncbi:MAG: tyrosine-type recombinase/integrase [Erythrobacter sp.]|nr:tyrosine-type recombinase/integrase [Erythrobacter sp.]
MPRDTLYLQKRGDKWGIRYRDKSTGRLIRITIGNYGEARKFRDTYLIPMFAAADTAEQLRRLQYEITENDKRVTRTTQEFRAAVQVIKGSECTTPQTITMREVWRKYIEHRKRGKNVGAATLSKLGHHAEHCCHFLGEDTPAYQVTRANILKMRDEMLETPRYYQKAKDGQQRDLSIKMSPNTVKAVLQRLKAVYAWAISEYVLPTMINPADSVEVETVSVVHKMRPTKEHADMLCALPVGRLKVDPDQWRWFALFQRYTGARVTEVAGLLVEDIVEVDGILCIHFRPNEVRTLKNKSSERLVPVSDKLRPHVLAAIDGRTGRIFDKGGDCIGGDGRFAPCHNMAKAFSRRAKEKVHPKISNHCWRVYARNEMIDAGVNEIDVCRIEGHSVESKVVGAYTPVDLARYKLAVDKIY